MNKQVILATLVLSTLVTACGKDTPPQEIAQQPAQQYQQQQPQGYAPQPVIINQQPQQSSGVGDMLAAGALGYMIGGRVHVNHHNQL